MDYTNRSVPNQQPAANAPRGVNNNTSSSGGGRFKKLRNGKWLNLASIVLLFSITIVIVAVAAAIAFSDAKREEKFVDKSKMQAVFLENGQVYFGSITGLNSSYLNLSNIYYLRVNQQVQPGKEAAQNDVSLVKLGCELHGPEDLMTINREQVTFWENLKSDGQVAKAVEEFVKQNPNGQNCEQQAQQAQQPQAEENAAQEEPADNSSNTESGDTNEANTNDSNTNNSSRENN